MSHRRRRSGSSTPPFFGNERFKANAITIAVVIVIALLGVVLLVKATNYGDKPPPSSVN